MAESVFGKPIDNDVKELNSNISNKTGLRDVGLVAKNTAIQLTDEEKSAKLLATFFKRYGYVQTAIFDPNSNYISQNPVIPSFGSVNGISIIPNAYPITSISFTGTDTEHNVTIIRIL